jgi:hypothetical protein
MRPLALLDQDGNKVLVGLQLDTLPPAQMNFKDMLLSVGCVCKNSTWEFARQFSASNAVQIVYPDFRLREHPSQYGSRRWKCTKRHVVSSTNATTPDPNSLFCRKWGHTSIVIVMMSAPRVWNEGRLGASSTGR